MTDYLHPSVSTTVTDNSFVYQTATGNTVLFQVILAEKGPDNVITMVTSPTEFIFKFGDPNLSKYGQASYNVLEWLRTGGLAYVIRILPTTATLAATGVGLELSKLASGNTQIAIKEYAAVQDFTSTAAMETFMAGERKLAADRATIPLGMVIPSGRGEGYNGLGVKFTLRDDLDATYTFRTYDLVVTAKDSLGLDVQVDGPFLVSLDPTARSKSRESLYWGTVVNRYSQFVKVVAPRSAYDTAYEFIVAATPSLDLGAIDILFGQPRNLTEATAYAKLEVVTAANAEDLDDTIVITKGKLYDVNELTILAGGKDGVWTGADAEDALLIKAYNGVTDPAVLDKKSYEFDVLLDGNHAPAVKEAMSGLANDVRGDCIAFVDLGFQATEAQTLAYRQASVNIAKTNTAIFAHHMEIYDAYNGENVKVTSTYLLASKIPSNDDAKGIQWTFVGPRRGPISGYENLNFIPNAVWREQFYKARINYIEKDPKKVNFATQLTSQAQNSALSDINNVRVLLRIKRETEALAADYRMEFNDSTTHDSMSYDVNALLQKWVANRACSSISATVSASDYDRQNKLARINISLVFTGIMERIAISITVNR